MPRRLLSLVLELSLPALLIGVLFFSASLTPSLIPRSWLLQGVLAGAMMGVGYMVTRFVQTLAYALGVPRISRRAARLPLQGLAFVVFAALAWSLWMNETWQNEIRALLEMEPTTGTHSLGLIAVGLAVFGLLLLVGALAKWLFDRIRQRLDDILSEAAANLLAIILVTIIIIVAVNRGLVAPAFNLADSAFEAAQNLMTPEADAPIGITQTGGPESLVAWADIGKPGRDFIRLGPDAAAISAFTGRPANEPLRIYVGRANGESPEARAALALDEMIRIGAFERAVLVIASPTGTGWLDPGSHDPLEYLAGGDIATVAVQYSHLTSPLALIFETEAGLDQAEATVSAIYDHWKTMPSDDRPRLYIHGLSLGAWSSMHAVNIFRLLNDPIDGALWSGPPFPSTLWQVVTANRNRGTPHVLPEIDDGNLIRFANQFGGLEDARAPWGDVRIIFLQYASDPIVFFDPGSTLRRPVWMTEPAAPDVYADLRFTPFVTQFQLALDMAIATSVPLGYGHNYDADDYIDAWASILEPGWSEADLDRLKAICGGDWGFGCQHPAAAQAHLPSPRLQRSNF